MSSYTLCYMTFYRVHICATSSLLIWVWFVFIKTCLHSMSKKPKIIGRSHIHQYCLPVALSAKEMQLKQDSFYLKMYIPFCFTLSSIWQIKCIFFLTCTELTLLNCFTVSSLNNNNYVKIVFVINIHKAYMCFYTTIKEYNSYPQCESWELFVHKLL